jgi:hypothetical protein
MNITILHSENVTESRQFMEDFNNNALAGVTIIDKHDDAVSACPNFSAYPTVVCDGRVLSPAPSWADALVWINSPSVQAPKVEFTRLEFLKLFTDAELVTLKSLESTDPVVGVFWEQYRTAESIRLDDERVINGVTYLGSSGYITPVRATEILGG